MDEIDVKILKCLCQNARENASVISERVSMSVSAVIERIKKMENSGIIMGHTTIINGALTGKDVTALISVSLEHPKYVEEFKKNVVKNPEILECHYIAGDYDFMIKVITDNTASLERLLNIIKSISGVQGTRTMVILSTSKHEHSVNPDELIK